MASFGFNNVLECFYYYFPLEHSDYLSLPKVFLSIIAGILVDNILGRRLGAVIFSGLIFLSQLLFAFGVGNGNLLLSRIATIILSINVECLAITSYCFIVYWYFTVR